MFKSTSTIALALAFLLAALTVAEAQEELVFYLPLDEGAGNPKDASGNPTRVSMEGNLEWVEGKFGKALEFDGDPANFLEAAHSAKLEGMKAITIMAWAKADAPDAKPRGIVSKREGGAQADVYNLFSYSGVKFCGRVDGWNINQTNLQTFSTTVLQDQTWLHVTYTFDGAAEEPERQKMYVNGVLEATKSHPDDVVLEGGSSLYIGILNEGYGQSWQGALDEVSIWSKALSEEEIQKFVLAPVSEVIAVQPQGRFTLTWGKLKSLYENSVD